MNCSRSSYLKTTCHSPTSLKKSLEWNQVQSSGGTGKLESLFGYAIRHVPSHRTKTSLSGLPTRCQHRISITHPSSDPGLRIFRARIPYHFLRTRTFRKGTVMSIVLSRLLRQSTLPIRLLLRYCTTAIFLPPYLTYKSRQTHKHLRFSRSDRCTTMQPIPTRLSNIPETVYFTRTSHELIKGQPREQAFLVGTVGSRNQQMD